VTAHFKLDIHPQSLRDASRQLATLAEHSQAKGNTVHGTPASIGNQWTGAAATSIKTEMTGLGVHMRGFATALRQSRAAVVTLAGHYEDAQDTVVDLNKKWAEADADYHHALGVADAAHDRSVKRAADAPGPVDRAERTDITAALGAAQSAAFDARARIRSRLEDEFDELKTTLRTQTRSAGSALTDAVPLPVPPAAIASYRRFHSYGFVLDRTRLEQGMPLTKELDLRQLKQLNEPTNLGPGFEEALDEQADKKLFTFSDAANTTAGQLIALQKKILNGGAEALRAEAELANARYLASPGGTPEARFQESMRYSKTMAAEALERRAASVARSVVGKLPVVGYGITAAGIGYDIHHGKRPGKAIFSGLAGAGGALAVTAMVGGPIGVGIVAGVVAGVAIGYGADYAYDHWMPDGAKKKIDEGLDAVGSAVGDAAGDVGDGAKKVWNSIF
jgi:uncharacterized protein YukE